jgi:hypothetical protein
MRARATIAFLLGLGGIARAATVVAVAPLATLTDDAPSTAPLQLLVAKGIAGVPGMQVVSDADLRKAVKTAKRPELLTCEGDPHCLADLGKLVGAAQVVSGEVGELTEGEVVYLKAVDVATGEELISTTAVFGKDPAARDAEARASAYRMLDPKAYVGSLELTIDVAKATVYLDGNQVGISPIGPLQVAVGTHALRVTQEQYHDFVRFVDVKFDEPTKLGVDLSAYPIVSDSMHQKLVPVKPYVGEEPKKWYQHGWAVIAVAAAVVVVTGLVVYEADYGVPHDRDVTAHTP